MTDTGLLITLALALIAATIGAAVAVRLGQSAILGYVVVGVLIGPYTAGPVADRETVAALADIGLVFLLFAIGLELSIGDLARVGRVAVIGGTVQVVALVVIGYLVGLAIGFKPLESLFFGAFVSQSSSMVMAKILGERGELDTRHGHLVLGWATLQDLSTIVLMVVLGGLAMGGDDLGTDIGLAVGKAALFIAILLPLGLKVLPWVLEYVARLRNREVFILSVVAVALGTAYSAEFFGVSLALGAFLAGLLVSESEISHHMLGELAPLRDVFAGIFFVSVGMLVDPAFVIVSFGLVVIAVLLVVGVKGAMIAGLSRLLGIPGRTAALAGLALAQSGEFSFLLARLGVDSGAVGGQMFSLMLASAGMSIALAPSIYRYAPAWQRRLDRLVSRGDRVSPVADAGPEAAGRYAVLVGYGRVGRLVAEALERRGLPYLVIEIDPRISRHLRERGIPVVQGPAESAYIRDRANLDRAQVLIITLPDPFALQQVVHHVRADHPRLTIIARARTAAEREFLRNEGVSEIVVAETEVALEMARYTLGRLGVSSAETQAIVRGLRRRATGT
jgi:K+:H+ antiporter